MPKGIATADSMDAARTRALAGLSALTLLALATLLGGELLLLLIYP